MVKQLQINKQCLASLCILLLIQITSAQLIFTNNTFEHIVVFNPAFSGIKPGFNRNYLDHNFQISSRINKKQSDITTSYQTFFNRNNIGISAYANSIFTSPNISANAGIGASYQLIFFDEYTTAWGLNVNFHHNNKSKNKELYFTYPLLTDTSLVTKTADITIGNMISYNNFILGFSTQPKILYKNLNGDKQNHFTLSTFYFKTLFAQLSRRSQINMWVNCNYYQFMNYTKYNQFPSKDLLYTSVQLHFISSGIWLFGAGLRWSNDSYRSYTGKTGLHKKRWNLTYGIEPYFMKNKYQSFINEFSFTFNLNK